METDLKIRLENRLALRCFLQMCHSVSYYHFKIERLFVGENVYWSQTQGAK